MTKKEILKKINKTYSQIPPACQQELLDYATIQSLKKGTVLVKEGQYATKTFYIINGCARAYYLKEGRDISDWFAFENEFISPIVSFFSTKPSPHYIELLEDSILVALTKEKIEELSAKYHDFERLIRMIVTNTMLRQQERIAAILFHTAEQRYKHILAAHPNIIKRVPLTHIASHLGITLETLSRIRNPKNRI